MYKTILLVFFCITSMLANPECYKEGYGELIRSVNDHEIVFKNGTVLPYRTNDLKNTWDEKLTNADLEMQISQTYRIDSDLTINYLYSPGRLRYQPFFQAIYGQDEVSISKNLVTIKWQTTNGHKNLLVSKIFGINEKLIEINKEILKLPFKERIFADSVGTYNYRFIKDTNRLSMHSYGIAIDLSPSATQYWKNEAQSETSKITYKNSMPLSIVRIFEKYGFIWGGRWYHYDTMHFEYRPELLAPSCFNQK